MYLNSLLKGPTLVAVAGLKPTIANYAKANRQIEETVWQ